MKLRFLGAPLAALLTMACTLSIASAATINVPGTQPTIQAAIGVASPGDLILVAPGTIVVTSTINVTVANLTIQGSGIGSTTLQVAQSVGNCFYVPPGGSGATIRDFSIQKTDLVTSHDLIWVNATNVTVRDNEFYGPDPGTPWSVNNLVSRAMVVSAGSTGLLVQGNNIHHLRQPAYFSGVNGVLTGNMTNNNVSGTRGWVVEGGKVNFTGNTWGPPVNQGAEIALLPSASSADYPNLLALSSANNNAYIAAQYAGGDFGRATAHVDASASPGGFGNSVAPYQAVSDGVANALTGGTVQVAAGTYTGQVVVGKNLTIQGAGRLSTIIKSPASLATSFVTSAANFPVMLLQNGTDIRVRDLTVDGDGQGNANYRFMGVAFWNAGGKLLDCDVKHVRETPFNGNQHGNAVYAFNNTGGPYSIEVGGCNVSDFMKNGITMNGSGLTANVHDCNVAGIGATAITAQNGVQVGYGANCSVTNCAVSSIGYTGAGYVACGLLLFDGSMTVTGGSVTDCQVGCYMENVNGGMSGTSISTSFVAGGSGYAAYGAAVYNTTASAPNASSRASSRSLAGRPLSSPFDENGTGPALSRYSVTSAAVVSISGGCLTGTDQANSIGLDVWSAGGPLSVTATGVEVSDWDYGMNVDGTNVTMNANHDAISSNVTAGYNGTAGPSHTAKLNWWGNATGPSGTGPGSGDAIAGATVAYAPWLISGADANPGCGFAPSADNLITPGPAPSCLSAANTCITIPVNIARTTSDQVRGFSVTLQLSSNLMLCTPSSITEGSYLNSVSGTAFQVVDNGGGSYTVDGAILGLPCGATAATGNLFNLQVKKAPGPDGTGTITIGTVMMRDCDNAPVAVNAGPALNITIDTSGPTAIANLAAVQKKTGNDADGTTKVQLTFTAPGDAATVEVYRAPFGQYPEYDDAGGAAPAAPSYPPSAPWTLTSVTASGQYDETTVRDFWYYVAFTKDACGNVSAVSNRTNGTLNYHLGDVSNGTPGSGDNLVGTIDVTLLGMHYGITLTPFDPYNYLDVGPTTDYSVNGRPTTDNKVGFEDLMMFAINYGLVSAPQDAPRLAAAGANSLQLDMPVSLSATETFTVPVRMSGAGDVMGASMTFAYDPKVVEYVSAEAGDLLAAQGRQAVVLSPGAGTVDFALLGEGAGVRGEGTLVNVTFRRIGTGDPALALKSITARDAANHPVALAGSRPDAPLTTQMGTPYPNPFRGRTSLRLAMAHNGQAKVAVYDLFGRRVRVLLDGMTPAGEQTLVWDGRDEGGRAVAAGLYLVRFDSPGIKQSRQLILMP